MTRDEILVMPAGREMDALIAEKVMGWIIHPHGTHYGLQITGEPKVTNNRNGYRIGEVCPYLSL